ncbi:MAG: hypothetical protein WCG44_03645, partial [bacterium]
MPSRRIHSIIRIFQRRFHHHQSHLPFLFFIPAGLAVFFLTVTLLSLTSSRPPSLRTGSGNVLYVVGNKSYSSNIGTKDGLPQISFTSNKSQASFILQGASKVKPIKKDSNTVLFPEVIPNVDLRYTSLLVGLKEDIIVKAIPTTNTFIFDLTLQGVTPKAQTTTNDKSLISPTFFDDKGKYQFHFDKPFALDASGARTDNVLLQITTDSTTGNYI